MKRPKTVKSFVELVQQQSNLGVFYGLSNQIARVISTRATYKYGIVLAKGFALLQIQEERSKPLIDDFVVWGREFNKLISHG